MTYHRVLPRDAFNEANMLKCLGQLSLIVHKYYEQDTRLQLSFDPDQPFNMDLNQDGGLMFTNLYLVIRDRIHFLQRPMNSREAYPIYLDISGEPITILTESGELTQEFKDLLA